MDTILDNLKELVQYKDLIGTLVRKDLRTRYKGSLLGFMWTFISPLLQLLVYSLVFPVLMKFNEKNYAMFLFVALIPWNYFASTIQTSCTVIIANTSLVSKIYFPRAVLPISNAISGMCNMLFSFIIVFPMLIIFKIGITINVLFLPLLIFSQLIMCTGFAMIFSSVNIYFRDIEHMVSIFLMMLYFLTPIIYNVDMMPPSFRSVLQLNPMTYFAVSYRDILYYGKPLGLQSYFIHLVVCIIIFCIGYLVFQKLQKNFTEIL